MSSNRLKEARLAAKLTAAQVAKELGIAYPSDVYLYESERRRPSPERKQDFATVLGVTVEYLFPETA